MKIIFLGTGGGRIVTYTQARATGGFILELGNNQVHVDPGPGALLRCIQHKINPRNTNILFLSHDHFDHVAGAWEIVEAMTGGGLRKGKKMLVGNKSCIEGNVEREIGGKVEKFSRVVQDYWYDLLEIRTLEAGKVIEFNGIKIEGCKAIHEDPNSIGVIFKFGEKKIGYTSDTEYSKEVAMQYRGCDLLILNVLRPDDARWPMHMCTQEVIEFINDCKVENVILQHFGMKMLRSGPEREANTIKASTGKNVIAAKDGLVIDIERFLSGSLLRF